MHRVYWCACGQKMRVPQHMFGQSGACISCGRTITPTLANTVAEAPSEPPPIVPAAPGTVLDTWNDAGPRPARSGLPGFIEGILESLNMALAPRNAGLSLLFVLVAAGGWLGIGSGGRALAGAWPGLYQYISPERLIAAFEAWWGLGCLGLIMGGVGRNVALEYTQRERPSFGTGLAFSLRYALGLSQCMVAGALAAGAAAVAVRAIPPLLMRLPSLGGVAAALLTVPLSCLLVYFGFLAMQVLLIPAAMAFERSNALNGFSRILELIPSHGGRLFAHEMAAVAVGAPLATVLGALALAAATAAAHACSADVTAVLWLAEDRSNILQAILGAIDSVGDAAPWLGGTWPVSQPLMTPGPAANWIVLGSMAVILGAAAAVLLSFVSTCCAVVYLSARDDLEG